MAHITSYFMSMPLVLVSPPFLAFSQALRTMTDMRYDLGLPSYVPSHIMFLQALALLMNSFTCVGGEGVWVEPRGVRVVCGGRTQGYLFWLVPEEIHLPF